ncbi:MAG: biopolymer transporter ExbD [Cellvibrionales bacterium]|nr:biopolymer transporter ExbD [Cellvibrionales bacterium]
MPRQLIKKDEGPNGDIDLTPMLDVVFIMLIFFIVTATFIKEPGIDVDRPQAVTAERILNQKILVAITADNQVWIDKSQVEEHMISQKISALHAENPKGAVVIQADKKSTAEKVALVIDAAKQAGVADISLAASE